MSKNILILLLLLFPLFLNAQSFYVSATRSGYADAIYKVTSTQSGFTSELMDTCPGHVFYSIGMNANGFYWLDGMHLFRADIVGNSLTNCTHVVAIPTSSNALTIGTDNKLYYATQSLYSTDPQTLESKTIGRTNYYPSGDMTFFNGDLYMASSQGIIKIDIQDPLKSFVYLPIDNNLNVFGMVSVATSLHKNTIYALSAVNGQTNIIELDLDNKKIRGVVGTLPYTVLDAASMVEDGSILGIVLDKVKVRQDCDVPAKGLVEIITKPHLEPFTYKLNSISNTTGYFTGVAPGSYQVTITSPSDEITTSITVPVYTLKKLDYTYQIKNQVCDAPGAVTFTTPDDNSLYSVKIGTDVFPLNHTFTGLKSGSNYHFEILNESGCRTDAVDIIIPKDKCQIQTVKADVKKECNALNKGSVQVLTQTHPDVYTYTLGNSSNTTGFFNALAPGNYTVNITSPEDASAVNFTIPDYSLTKPVLSYRQTNPVCEVKGKIKFNTTDNAAYQIMLDQAVFPLDHEFTELSSKTYFFTILDQQKCMIDTITIKLKQDKCSIKFDQTSVQQQCDAIHKGVVKVLSKTHADPYFYTLNGASNTTGIFSNLETGSYKIKITSAEDTVEVTAIVPDYKLTQPVISYIVKDEFCAVKGDIRFIISDKSDVYQIRSGADVFPADHIFSGLKTGSYHFTVLRQNGCLVDEFEVLVKYQPCPIVINSIDVSAECSVLGKGLIRVTCADIPETYNYSLNGTSNTTGIFNLLNPGTYQLTVSASGGNVPQTRTVIIPDFSLNKPVTVIKQTNPVCELPGQLKFTVGSNPHQYTIQYLSAIYPSDHLFTGLTAGNYHFSIRKKDGCMADALDVVLVQEKCSPVSFPSAFTPNQDGVNDVFRANPESQASNFKLQIFNRYGELLYVLTDLHNGWNGEYKSKPAPMGIYYWIATFTTQDNKPLVQKGYITLIR